MAIDYLSNPTLRGKENYLAGYRLEDNPYPENSEQFELWRSAWLEQSKKA